MPFCTCIQQCNDWNRHWHNQNSNWLMKPLQFVKKEPRNALIFVNFGVSCSLRCCLSQCRWIFSSESICGMVMASHRLNHALLRKLRCKVYLIVLISSYFRVTGIALFTIWIYNTRGPISSIALLYGLTRRDSQTFNYWILDFGNSFTHSSPILVFVCKNYIFFLISDCRWLI